MRADLDPGFLSRLERGEREYSQEHIEALATALKTSPAALLYRDPGGEDAELWEMWESLSAADQQVILTTIGALIASKRKA